MNQLTQTIIQLRYPDLEQIIKLFIQYPNQTRQFYLQKLSSPKQNLFNAAVGLLSQQGILFQIQLPVIKQGKMTNKQNVIYHIIHKNLINFELASLPTAYLPQNISLLYSFIAVKPCLTTEELQKQIQQEGHVNNTKNIQQSIDQLVHMQLVMEQQDFPSNQQILQCINEYFSQNNYNPNEVKNKKIQGLKPEIGGVIRKLIEGRSEYHEAQQNLIIRNNEERNNDNSQEFNEHDVKKERYLLNLQYIPGFLQLNIYAQSLEQKFGKEVKILFLMHFLTKPSYNQIQQVSITNSQLDEKFKCLSELDLGILQVKNQIDQNEYNKLNIYFDQLQSYGAIQQNNLGTSINWEKITSQNKNQIVLQILQSRHNGDSARIVYCLQNSQVSLPIEKIQNQAVVDINNLQQNLLKLLSEGWIQQQNQQYICNSDLAYQVAKNILCNSLSNLLKKYHQSQQTAVENQEIKQISQAVQQLKNAVSIFI